LRIQVNGVEQLSSGYTQSGCNIRLTAVVWKCPDSWQQNADVVISVKSKLQACVVAEFNNADPNVSL